MQSTYAHRSARWCARLVWLAVLVILNPVGGAGDRERAEAAGLREIFYAPFDTSPNAVIARGQAAPYQARVDGFIDGIKGKAVKSVRKYNGIRWDGRGNIDLDRGAFALFYCPMNEPNVAQRDSLFGVSTDIEGSWAGIVNFLNKKDQVADILQVPSDLDLMAVVALGYPAETKTGGSRKPIEELIVGRK